VRKKTGVPGPHKAEDQSGERPLTDDPRQGHEAHLLVSLEIPVEQGRRGEQTDRMENQQSLMPAALGTTRASPPIARLAAIARTKRRMAASRSKAPARRVFRAISRAPQVLRPSSALNEKNTIIASANSSLPYSAGPRTRPAKVNAKKVKTLARASPPARMAKFRGNADGTGAARRRHLLAALDWLLHRARSTLG